MKKEIIEGGKINETLDNYMERNNTDKLSKKEITNFLNDEYGFYFTARMLKQYEAEGYIEKAEQEKPKAPKWYSKELVMSYISALIIKEIYGRKDFLKIFQENNLKNLRNSEKFLLLLDAYAKDDETSIKGLVDLGDDPVNNLAMAVIGGVECKEKKNKPSERELPEKQVKILFQILKSNNMLRKEQKNMEDAINLLLKELN